MSLPLPTDGENPNSERAKMLRGDLYDASAPDLLVARQRARDLLGEFNNSPESDRALREPVLAMLFGRVGTGLVVEPPFFCDYGTNIQIGDRVYFNTNCVVLDPAAVIIGSDVLFGPGVQILTATHPVDWRERRTGLESAKAITIGDDVWIGGGAILCPGVTVGSRSVVGAGSVVVRDVPEGVVVAGNPARVIRELPADRSFLV